MAQGVLHGGSHGPGTQPGTDHLVDHHEEHPGPNVYVQVAIILAIVTAIEVAIYYIDWVKNNGALVPALLVFSAFKFVAVVGYFMHLKYDDKRLTWTFVSGLVVALSIILALFAMFRSHQIDTNLYIGPSVDQEEQQDRGQE